MNRNQFVRYTNELTGVAMSRLSEAIDAITEGILDAIENGETVKIQGIGTLKTKTKKASKRGDLKNPGKIIESPAVTMVKFVPSQQLIDAARRSDTALKKNGRMKNQ